LLTSWIILQQTQLLKQQNFKDIIPDSLKFKTAAGRDVFGGGGIVPDIIVQEDTTASPYLFNFMLINRVDFDFVRDYLDDHGDRFREQWEDDFQAFRSDFEWSDEDRALLLSMMQEQGMEITNDVDEPTIEDNTLKLSREMYDELSWMNHGQLKAEIARQVWGTEYYYPVVNDFFNETLSEAMNLWAEVERLETFAQQQSRLMESSQ
jgi:carboxyl-terminal processing protease